MKKNRLNRLKFFKNQPVRFQFYKSEIEKTELNPNRKKTETNRKNRAKTEKTDPTGLNRFCPKKPNQTESKPVGLNWFRFDFFFKFNSVIFFFYKNQIEPKIITLYTITLTSCFLLFFVFRKIIYIYPSISLGMQLFHHSFHRLMYWCPTDLYDH